jgi:hypothetical protein
VIDDEGPPYIRGLAIHFTRRLRLSLALSPSRDSVGSAAGHSTLILLCKMYSLCQLPYFAIGTLDETRSQQRLNSKVAIRPAKGWHSIGCRFP